MSIAVCTTIHPSTRLKRVVGAMGAAMAGVGLVAGTGWGGTFTMAGRLAIAGACAICTMFALFHLLREKKVYRLDVGADGSLRLGEAGSVPEAMQVVRLMPSSTLWPQLMLLRLQLEAPSGRLAVLHVWPDSVTPQEFRALSVALRWLAAHSAALRERETT